MREREEFTLEFREEWERIPPYAKNLKAYQFLPGWGLGDPAKESASWLHEMWKFPSYLCKTILATSENLPTRRKPLPLVFDPLGGWMDIFSPPSARTLSRDS